MWPYALCWLYIMLWLQYESELEIIVICESTYLQKIFTDDDLKTREGIQDFCKDTGVEGSSLGSPCTGQALLDNTLPSVWTSCICKTKREISFGFV